MSSVGTAIRLRAWIPFLLGICAFLPMTVFAQQYDSWQQAWQETMNPEDNDEDVLSLEDYYDLLQDLSEHPIDLNSTTHEELEQLPFLSEQQVMDIIEYRDRYHPMRSLGELRMIRSLDYQQLTLLSFFTFVGEVIEKPFYPKLGTMLQNGRHELTLHARVPLYNRAGDDNGYLGYKYRHWMRYEFSYGDYLRVGLLGSQDAGEPFFSNGNRWGYDTYSYYLQIKKLGPINNAVLGKYKVSTGMGLVLSSSFSLGKQAILQNLGRQQTSLRAHASRSEADYFQGAAAILSLHKKLTLTAFASYRPFDATLNDDGTVATLITNGYHRTPKEMEKKNNTHQTAAGADITFRHNALNIGITAVYTHQSPSLEPNTKTLYRRFYPTGNNFLNSSLHYGYMHHRFSFNGETAINKDGAIATINALSYQSRDNWSLMALQRFYSYRYTALYGHAFSEGGRVQNESGIYLGATWQPFTKLQLRGYADFAYFPQARYRISQSSTAQDYMGEATFTPNKSWTIKGRYRLHLRELDNKKKTALRRHNEHRARLTAIFTKNGWTFTTQADGVRAVNYAIEHGWMLSEQVSWKHAWWQLALTAGYFNTDSYDSRIYVYERQLPRNFAFPMYYGRGTRLALVARANIGETLQIDAKIGSTHYADREVISSGLQQIDGNTQTDVDLQVRWRF